MTQARFTGKPKPVQRKNTPARVTRFHASATERANFRTCRRRWYLQDVEHMVPKDNVTWYLIFGDCMHAAMDAYYRYNRNLTDAETAFEQAWQREDAELQAKFANFYRMGIEEEWEEHRVKGLEILRHYHTFDRAHPFFDEVVDLAIEERGFVDILDAKRKHQPGFPLLSGRIDLVVRRKRDLWVVDHKALAYAPTIKYLDIDDQLTAYCYIYWRLTGEKPKGGMYNVLIKDPPKFPRLLKDGKLSKDKSQRTTFELYLQMIHDLGLNVKDYEEHLNWLSSKGWSQFFIRDQSERNMDQMLEFEQHLFHEAGDMQRVLASPQLAYPNPTQYTCGGCAVLPICQSMEERGNVEWVRDHGFRQDPPRVEIPDEILDPKWKGV